MISSLQLDSHVLIPFIAIKNIELSIILIHEVCFVKILSLLLPVLSRSIMFSSFLHNFLQFFPLHDLISITFVLTKEKYMAALNILYEDPHILVCVKPHGIATQSKSIRYPDMVSLIKTIWRNPVVPGTPAQLSLTLPSSTDWTSRSPESLSLLRLRLLQKI